MSARASKKTGLNRDFLKGKLLIATPNLRDPRFERSVVFLCDHDESHAFGLIVNKPLAEVSMSEVLEKLDVAADDAEGAGPVFYGGPVGMERGAVLHTLDYRIDGTIDLTPELGLTWTREILVDMVSSRRRRPPPKKHLFVIGYAGWGVGQLESEISQNSWAHCPYKDEIVFARDPSRSWERALAAIGVTAAMLSGDWTAGRPPDAPLN
jgi:putative transcriptional regulator